MVDVKTLLNIEVEEGRAILGLFARALVGKTALGLLVLMALLGCAFGIDGATFAFIAVVGVRGMFMTLLAVTAEEMFTVAFASRAAFLAFTEVFCSLETGGMGGTVLFWAALVLGAGYLAG